MDDELSDAEVKKTVKSIEKIFDDFIKLLKNKKDKEWLNKLPSIVMFFNKDELCSGYVLKDNNDTNEEHAKRWILHAKKYNPVFILNCSASSDESPHDGKLVITHLGNQLVSHYLHKNDFKSTEGWEEIW